MQLREILQDFMQGWVQATKEPFTAHPTATLFRQDFCVKITTIVKAFDPLYEVKASVGAGNWANVSWLSILNPKITNTTQEGIYPVYLFNADGSGFYLSLMQGTTNPTKKLGKVAAELQASQIKDKVLNIIPGLKEWGIENIDLKATTSLGQSYEKSNISAKYYDVNNIPSDDQLQQDLETLLAFYKQIENISWLPESPKMEENLVKVTNLTSLSKPFLLLAGISGTGKTRFVREQAKASNPTGELGETYCLISVRPDWHEPSDLLGYTSRLSGDSEYVTTEVLQFIVKSWIEIQQAGVDFSSRTFEGNRNHVDKIRPFWLCLDEMNLAPVEQYFADYLSVLETREWQWTGDNFMYDTDALLTANVITTLSTLGQHKLRLSLGLAEAQFDHLWHYFQTYGIGIPFNLIVAGTVNMDETTHSFSRKVIDRALSYDFGEYFPNNYEDYFIPQTAPKAFSYPIWSNAKSSRDKLPAIDKDGEKSIAFLTAVNQVLSDSPFKLAFRALNELLLSVISHQPNNEFELQAVWDDFLMCKVLPRIEGDADKLQGKKGSDSILLELTQALGIQLSDIWYLEIRPDLHREKLEGPNKVILIPCRSKAKLEWMQKRLALGFTSFWP